MTKRLRIIFVITLTYFFIIIPVQSEQQVTGEQQNVQENNYWPEITSENVSEITQENAINDTGQDIQIEENSSGSINWPQTDQNLSENNFETGTNLEIDQINQLPQIIISEIYYDGTEEWIEITNLWSYFSGEVELEVPQSIFFPVSLQPNQSIILTKVSQLYNRISPLIVKQQLPLSFSFTDTKAIFATLWRSGQLLDMFQAETGLVTKFDNKKTSLIKQYNNQIWIITGLNSSINVISPYIASPGFWESWDFFTTTTWTFFQTWTNWNITTSWNIQTGDFQITSWSNLGGGGMSGIVDTPTPTSPQPDILSITEIFYGNSQFSSFIEIKAHQDFNGKVFFTGSLLKSALELDIFLEKNEYLIVVYTDNWWLSDQKKSKKPSLELNTSWLLQLLGQSGQVFDTIQVLSISWNKSNYIWLFSNWDIDIFSKIDNFSPGFDEKYLVYSNIIFQVSSWQNNQDSWFSDQTSSGGLSTGTTQNWQDMSWTVSTGIIINPKNLQITALTHLNPESITIKSNLNFTIDLSKKDRYLLTKETQTGDRKTTKKYLTGILASGQSTTISKTRWFLDAWSCVGLFYQTGQLDQRCYGSALAKPEEEIEPELEDNIPNIQILWVLPNPVGKDDKEELHLLRTWSVIASGSVAIQNLTLSPKSLYFKTNTTKKYLTTSLKSNQTTILKGSLGLVNKSACIELRYKTTLLDTFCYPDPLEWEFIPRGGRPVIPEYLPSIKILSALPNPSGKDDAELISLLRTTPTTWSVIASLPTGQAGGSEAIQLENKPLVIANERETIQTDQPEMPSSITFDLKNNNSLYLLHNTTKKYLSGRLKPNEEIIFTGSLGLLNKAHCFELRYKQYQLDRFCYPNPREDEYFGTWNYILQTIQKSDFNILQKVWFIVIGSKICVSYYDQFLTCRSLPASKTSIKLKNENKLYKTYFTLFQNYLMKDRSTLYYNTDIKIYFDTFKQAKSTVSKFNQTVSISGQQFNVYDLSGQIELTTVPQWLSWKQFQEQKSWIQKFLIWLGV